jgi:DNA polymerase
MPTVSRVLQTALASSNAQNPSIQFPPCPEVSLLEWPALREATQVCQSCALSLTRKQAVFGAGALSDSDGQVDWLVIAESPNDEEQTQGEPFVGDAGVLLDNMLSACGLSRTLQTGRGRVFVTHATKCSPPGGRNAKPQEWEQCQTYLHRQIELLRPRMILAMGRLSANALLRENLPDVQALPLGKLRGQVHQFRGTPVVVTFHPAYVMRNLHEKAKVWADLCLAQAQLSDH